MNLDEFLNLQGFEPRGTIIHGWNEATTRMTTRLIAENGSLSYFPPVPSLTATSGVETDSSESGRRRRQVGGVDATGGSTSRRRRRQVQDECLSEALENVAQQIITAAVIKASIEDR